MIYIAETLFTATLSHAYTFNIRHLVAPYIDSVLLYLGPTSEISKGYAQLDAKNIAEINKYIQKAIIRLYTKY